MLAGRIKRELAGKGGHGLLERKKCWQKETVAPSHRAQGTPIYNHLLLHEGNLSSSGSLKKLFNFKIHFKKMKLVTLT